jgi:hypothetical protein
MKNSLFFGPEDGGDKFLRNVGRLPMKIDFFTTTAEKTSNHR